MDRIEVSLVNRVCANCGLNGHPTGSSICALYGINVRPVYRSRCSRCNQPGHNRSNRRICSLYNEYPEYYYLTHTGVISRSRRIDLVKDLMRESRRNLIVFTDQRDWIHMDLSAHSCKGGLGAVNSDVTGFGVSWAFHLLSRL